jgi:hypothetical protein
MERVNTTDKGNRTEAFVLGALMRTGYTVLVPFGGGLRYDMVFEDSSGFHRVQCKTGRIVTGAVEFAVANHNRAYERRNYVDDIDYFGVYCYELDTVYLVPVADLPSGSSGRLRVEPSKNNQAKGVRWASEYVI